MSKKDDMTKTLKKIVDDDVRYELDAYLFVLSALEYTMRKKKKIKHISGKELLEGIREFGLEEYGPMTKTVLNHWGVKNCQDFGEIVFSLVENGLLKKSEEDSREDFNSGYDFTDVFEKPFHN